MPKIIHIIILNKKIILEGLYKLKIIPNKTVKKNYPQEKSVLI